MLISLLLTLALLVPDRLPGERAAAQTQFQQAPSELRPCQDTESDDFEREVAAENVEDESDDDAQAYSSCELIEKSGTPPYRIDHQHSLLLAGIGTRHRQKRAPPIV
jgi:hypothetical protein